MIRRIRRRKMLARKVRNRMTLFHALNCFRTLSCGGGGAGIYIRLLAFIDFSLNCELMCIHKFTLGGYYSELVMFSIAESQLYKTTSRD